MDHSLKAKLRALQMDLRDIQKRMEELESQLSQEEADESEFIPIDTTVESEPPAEVFPPATTEIRDSEDAASEFYQNIEQVSADSKSSTEAEYSAFEIEKTPDAEAKHLLIESLEPEAGPESESRLDSIEWPEMPSREKSQVSREEEVSAVPSLADAAGRLTHSFVQRWIFGGNPIAKIGIFILFLGLAFALRYAAELGLLPVWLRYTAVALAGLAMLALGWRWRAREDSYGLVMQGGGIAVLYLTTLAAMKIHPLLDMGYGFAILVMVAAVAATLSVMQNAFVLALIAALGGFAAPVLASTGEGNHILLFSYLAVLNLGLVSIAWFKSWRTLNIIGYVSSFGLGGAWALQHYRDELFWTTEPYLLLLFVIYVLVTFLFARRTLADTPLSENEGLFEMAKSAPGEVRYVDGSLAFGVPFSAFWVQHHLVAPFQYGAAISAAAFGTFYFLIAWLLVFRTGKRYALLAETMVVLGIVFGTLSIPLLETPWTSAAWAVEAAGVYWVGFRQRQTYIRLIALAVLLGSAVYFLPELRPNLPDTVLDGPILAAVLLTFSTGITYWLISQEGVKRLSALESRLRPVIVAFGGFMLATIPLLLLPAEWASPVLALLGTGLVGLSIRRPDRLLAHAGWTFQFVGGLLFLTTLKSGTGDTVLAHGWAGLVESCLVGAAMATGYRLVGKKPTDTKTASSELPATLALLAGLVFFNLAPLFILPWRFAAMAWPVAGIAILVWAIRSRHASAILFAFGLQLVSGVAHLHARSGGDLVALVSSGSGAFLNNGCIGPTVISLASLLSARLVHQGLGKQFTGELLGWIGLVWAGFWWIFGWHSELVRVTPELQLTASFTAITIVTVLLMRLMASRLDWLQLMKSTAVYLPVLIIIMLDASPWRGSHPLAGWSAVTWPLALVMHGFLLLWQKPILEDRFLKAAHVAGAWLFILLATVEVRWWFTQWSEPASAWPLLGTVLVPALYIWALTRDSIQSSWPVLEFHRSYVMVSAIPVIAYLAVWLWSSNTVSNGDPQPLPYVPVFNPLELAYLATMVSGFAWWRTVRAGKEGHDADRFANLIFFVTGFALLTGGIIRACHHWADIPWQFDAMMASYTVQTSLSIAWGLLAISLMLLGNRRGLRSIWFTGGMLVAVVVGKLFLVELSASGTLQRIVSFVGVGLLLLLIAYIAPLPPRRDVPKK
jgi:uncharacterized membrane protein